MMNNLLLDIRNLKLSFNIDNDTIDYFSIDLSPCLTPSNQAVSLLTDTSAVFSWNELGGSTSWQIRVDTTGFDTTGMTPVSAGTNPFTYTALEPSATYDWYVRAD